MWGWHGQLGSRRLEMGMLEAWHATPKASERIGHCFSYATRAAALCEPPAFKQDKKNAWRNRSSIIHPQPAPHTNPSSGRPPHDRHKFLELHGPSVVYRREAWHERARDELLDLEVRESRSGGRPLVIRRLRAGPVGVPGMKEQVESQPLLWSEERIASDEDIPVPKEGDNVRRKERDGLLALPRVHLSRRVS